jgi:membrane protease YdiL (CAAX protease family)
MATDVTPPLQESPTLPTHKQPIAPPLHTLGLIAAVLALSFTGADRLAANANRPHGRLVLYIATIMVDWVIVGYIWMGLKRRGVRLRDVIGGKWQSGEDMLLDAAIAVGFWLSWSFLVVAVSFALGSANLDPAKTMGKVSELKKSIGFIVPQGITEIFAFIALTMTAGFCEELIYRGYFQQQFRAWTNNLWLAILAQGVLFGASHGYQGWKSMLVIAIFGCAFGLLAAWRKSLRPGMMAHAWQDLFSGFVLKLAMKLAP